MLFCFNDIFGLTHSLASPMYAAPPAEMLPNLISLDESITLAWKQKTDSWSETTEDSYTAQRIHEQNIS